MITSRSDAFPPSPHQPASPEQSQQRPEAHHFPLTAIALFHLDVTWAYADPPAAPETVWQLEVAAHPDGVQYQVTATLTHNAPWGHLETRVAALTDAPIATHDTAPLRHGSDEGHLKAHSSPALWAFARAVSLPLVVALPDVGEPTLPQEPPPFS